MSVPTSSTAAAPTTHEEICAYLAAKVARIAAMSAADVRVSAPIASYGLSSLDAVLLVSEIEATFGELPMDVLKGCSTIADLADRLAVIRGGSAS